MSREGIRRRTGLLLVLVVIAAAGGAYVALTGAYKSAWTKVHMKSAAAQAVQTAMRPVSVPLAMPFPEVARCANHSMGTSVSGRV